MRTGGLQPLLLGLVKFNFNFRLNLYNSITATSTLRILMHDGDAYVAEIDGKVVVKIGSRYDVGAVIPAGFVNSAHGKDYAVWEKAGAAANLQRS